MKCLMCNSNLLSSLCEVENISYKGKKLSVSMAYNRCNNCEHEFVVPEQIRSNDQAIILAKREVDGLLSPAAIREIRVNLGLNQEQAAMVFGGGRNAFSKYERGEVTQSVAMDKLIRLCAMRPELLAELRAPLLKPQASAIQKSEQKKIISIEDWQNKQAVTNATYSTSNTIERTLSVLETGVVYEA